MLVIKDSTGKILAKSDVDLISVGREEDNTIVVDQDAVSGYHGIFFRVDDFWVYRDNFSTNGSFLNGISLRSGQTRIVKNADLIRLASYPLQCEVKTPTISNKIIVIKGFDPVGILSVPELSSTLLIDSSVVSNYEGAEITLNRSQEGILSLSVQDSVTVNNKPHQGNMNLVDQDQIDVGDYTFLICYTSLPTRPSRQVPDRDYDPGKKMAETGKSSVFSAAKHEVTEIKKGSDFRAEMSMSQRLATIAGDEESERIVKVENAYAAFGVLVLFTSIGFVVFALSLF